jgi:hypothetical protein
LVYMMLMSVWVLVLLLVLGLILMLALALMSVLVLVLGLVLVLFFLLSLSLLLLLVRQRNTSIAYLALSFAKRLILLQNERVWDVVHGGEARPTLWQVENEQSVLESGLGLTLKSGVGS